MQNFRFWKQKNVEMFSILKNRFSKFSTSQIFRSQILLAKMLILTNLQIQVIFFFKCRYCFQKCSNIFDFFFNYFRNPVKYLNIFWIYSRPLFKKTLAFFWFSEKSVNAEKITLSKIAIYIFCSACPLSIICALHAQNLYFRACKWLTRNYLNYPPRNKIS